MKGLPNTSTHGQITCQWNFGTYKDKGFFHSGSIFVIIERVTDCEIDSDLAILFKDLHDFHNHFKI